MRLRLIVLILFSPVIMFLSAAPAGAQTVQQEINNGLCAGSNLELPPNDPDCKNTVNESSNSINRIAHHVINVLSAVVALVAVVMIIFGGFRYVTSGGNDSSVNSAKNTILYAIIGLVIVALSQILVHFTIRNISG